MAKVLLKFISASTSLIMRLLKPFKPLLVLTLIGAVVGGPLYLLSHYANDIEAATKSNFKTESYTYKAGSPPAPASVPAAAAEVLVEADQPTEPALGCWEVQGTTGDQPPALDAIWHPGCPLGEYTALDDGEHPWPLGPVYLAAWAPGQPVLSKAKPYSELKDTLAYEYDAIGALLFLPATKDGRGYYVAGWQKESEDEADKPQRGISVGRYGNPPFSVSTKAGRIYMEEDYNPRVE